MGSWCHRYLSGSDLTSYFVDSLNHETPVGQRWREVRDEWKTIVGEAPDDSGKIRFNGFCGQYQILLSCELDTFYLEPGEGTKTVEFVYQHDGPETTFVNHALAGVKKIEISVNGISTPIKLTARYKGQLFVATYSLSGKQLSRSPVNPAGGKHRVPSASSCCRVLRIETADRLPLYTGKITAVR